MQPKSTTENDEPLPSLVPAKDFARKIGQYQRQALVKPVTITAHGEPTLVVLSVAEYQRLKRRAREALSIDTMSLEQVDEMFAALEAQKPPAGGDEFDRELDGWKP
jgi:prevent-host-death family protein